MRKKVTQSALRTGVALLALSAGIATAQDAGGIGESFFVRTLYPMLHAAQCVRCHSDNGVASETSLEFPRADASDAQIAAFGLSLLDLVDRKHPDESLLIQKPTRRVKHTGGQRIKPGSVEEEAISTWIKYLADLSDEQVRAARQKIAAAEKRKLITGDEGARILAMGATPGKVYDPPEFSYEGTSPPPLDKIGSKKAPATT